MRKVKKLTSNSSRRVTLELSDNTILILDQNLYQLKKLINDQIEEETGGNLQYRDFNNQAKKLNKKDIIGISIEGNITIIHTKDLEIRSSSDYQFLLKQLL